MRVSQSLVQGLLLLEDINVLSDSTEDSLARRLQWHTIEVIFSPCLSFIVWHIYSFVVLVHFVISVYLITVVLLGCTADLRP